MSNSIRFVSVLGLAAVAAASQAITVNIVSYTSGNSNVKAPPSTFNSTVLANNSDVPFSYPGIGSVTNINFQIGTNASTATYTSNTAGQTGAFTISFTSTTDATGNGALSFSSPAMITSASGVFSSYNGLAGLTVASNSNTGSGTNTFSLATNTVTPEPASLAALGVGAVALLRRRRKA